jgi:5-enolpyruvylshikimate-3-phosphate synthase
MLPGGNASLVVPRATGPVIGDLHPPGSKSLTQRWLLLAALAEGESTIENALRSDDVRRSRRGFARWAHAFAGRAPTRLWCRVLGGAFLAAARLMVAKAARPRDS